MQDQRLIEEQSSAATADLSEHIPAPSMVSFLVLPLSADNESIVDEGWLAKEGLADITPPGPTGSIEAAVERITNVSATVEENSALLVREVAPLNITPIAQAPTPPPPVAQTTVALTKKAKTPHPRIASARHDWTPLAPYSDRFDLSLPEARRRGPKPLDWRKELGFPRNPVREKTLHHETLFDLVFIRRAFKVFAVLTFALALLAVDLRFARTLQLSPDALSLLRMLAHLSIGGAVVFLLRATDRVSRK